MVHGGRYGGVASTTTNKQDRRTMMTTVVSGTVLAGLRGAVASLIEVGPSGLDETGWAAWWGRDSGVDAGVRHPVVLDVVGARLGGVVCDGCWVAIRGLLDRDPNRSDYRDGGVCRGCWDTVVGLYQVGMDGCWCCPGCGLDDLHADEIICDACTNEGLSPDEFTDDTGHPGLVLDGSRLVR